MRKQIINPDTGSDWAAHETAYSDGVVVHAPNHKRVYLSGRTAADETIEDQTRSILDGIRDDLDSVGGDMRDVVRVRIYISRPHMDAETLQTVHAVRREFFERGHYPSSTLVEVEALVSEDYLIEIDADAVIPEDGWEVETL